MRALTSWGVPSYLLQIFGSYFSGRSETADCQLPPEGSMEVIISGEVPQRSVVGPLLWNLAYNYVLTQDLPARAEIIGFADDTLVLASGKSMDDLAVLANNALGQVTQKICNLRLSIAAEKTEAVFFTNDTVMFWTYHFLWFCPYKLINKVYVLY